MKTIETPLGKKVGQLTDQEKNILIAQLTASVKIFKIMMIFAVLSIVLIVGIFIAPAMYFLIVKLTKRINLLKTEEIEVYEVSGILSVEQVGKGTGWVCKIDGTMIPGDVVRRNGPSKIEGFIDQQVTFQFAPQISKNRQYCNSDGQGYNFITDTILTDG